MDPLSDSTIQIDNRSWLYKNFFEGSVKYEYDTRIDEYNWPAIFLAFLTFYFAMHAALRKLVAEPGPKKIF